MITDEIAKKIAEEARKACSNCQEWECGNCEYRYWRDMRWEEETPTVDAEPVRHAHWIDTGSGQECSECHEIQYGYDSGRYYCANCGAKMDEATDEQTKMH